MKSTTEKNTLKNIRYKNAELAYIKSNKTLRLVCKEYQIDRHSFSNYLKSKNISTRKKINSCDTMFEIIDTEEKAYWLGFLYADGCVSYNKVSFPTRYVVELSLKESDKVHIEKFQKFMNSTRNIEYRKNTKSFRIQIFSKKLCEDLIKLGCTNKKSLTLKFPTLEQVPLNFINSFIRGYVDGDGSIVLNNKTNCLNKLMILGTKEFLDDLIKIKQLTCSLKKDKRHLGNTFNIVPNIQESMSLLNSIYSNGTVYLERKYNLYLLAVQHRNELNYERAKTVKGEIPNTVLSTLI